jgi:hypothetical protein
MVIDMKILDIFEYKRHKLRIEQYGELLSGLDKVADILYNHLSYAEVWQLIQLTEEARIRYGIEYQASVKVLNTYKGNANEKS